MTGMLLAAARGEVAPATPVGQQSDLHVLPSGAAFLAYAGRR
jgi:hypothetical protein